MNCKKSYRKQILEAKNLAFQNDIDQADNKCQAAWNVISGKNAPNRTREVPLDPKLLNNYFLDLIVQTHLNLTCYLTYFHCKFFLEGNNRFGSI